MCICFGGVGNHHLTDDFMFNIRAVTSHPELLMPQNICCISKCLIYSVSQGCFLIISHEKNENLIFKKLNKFGTVYNWDGIRWYSETSCSQYAALPYRGHLFIFRNCCLKIKDNIVCSSLKL